MMLRQEMDFVAEAENARAIRGVFSSDPTVVVPEIVTSLSGPSVIVMDYVEGVSLDRLVAKPDVRTRLTDSIETTLKLSTGIVTVLWTAFVWRGGGIPLLPWPVKLFSATVYSS